MKPQQKTAATPNRPQTIAATTSHKTPIYADVPCGVS